MKKDLSFAMYNIIIDENNVRRAMATEYPTMQLGIFSDTKFQHTFGSNNPDNCGIDAKSIYRN